MFEASKTSLKPSKKEDDWNTSQYSHDSTCCRGRGKQVLIVRIAPETTNRGIKSHSIINLFFITRILLTMNINHYVENHVVFVVYITMWLLSAGKEWQ